MKLENLGKNQTRLIMQIQDHKEDFTWDKDIYFSYGTPVLVVNYRDAEIHETAERYSSTTSKHITQFKSMCNRYDERGGLLNSSMGVNGKPLWHLNHACVLLRSSANDG